MIGDPTYMDPNYRYINVFVYNGIIILLPHYQWREKEN